jgi:hypothetical protein
MLHLHARRRISTLDIEGALGRVAIEKALGTSYTFGNRVESIDHSQTKTLGLVTTGDANLLDMTDTRAIPDASHVDLFSAQDSGGLTGREERLTTSFRQ